MTTPEELMYLAASAKAQIATADHALREAIGNLKILAETPSHKRALRSTVRLAVLACRALLKTSDAMFAYFDRAYPGSSE